MNKAGENVKVVQQIHWHDNDTHKSCVKTCISQSDTDGESGIDVEFLWDTL
jgi:hypothetical protein